MEGENNDIWGRQPWVHVGLGIQGKPDACMSVKEITKECQGSERRRLIGLESLVVTSGCDI